MKRFSRKLYLLTLLILFLSLPKAYAARIASIVVGSSQISIQYTGGKVSSKSFGLKGSKPGTEKLVIDLEGADLAASKIQGASNLAPVTIRVNQFSASPLVTRVVLEGDKNLLASFKVASNSNGKLTIAYKSGSKDKPKLPTPVLNDTNTISDVQADEDGLLLSAAKEIKYELKRSQTEQSKKLTIDLSNSNLFSKALAKTYYIDKEEIRVSQSSSQSVRIQIDGPEADLWNAKVQGTKLRLFKNDRPIPDKAEEPAVEEVQEVPAGRYLNISGSSPSTITVRSLEGSPIKYKVFQLHAPERLILDVYNWDADLSELKPSNNPSSLVIGVRSGRPSHNSSVARLVFDLTQKGIVFQDKLNADKSLLTLTLAPPPLSDAMQAGLKELRNVRGGLKVVLDAGHGGYDAGAIYSGVEEKKLTLAMTKYLKEALAPTKIQVLQTRKDDQFVSLEERVNITRQAKPDLFVSIHCNAMQSSSAIHGIETYYFTPQSRALANLLHRKVVAKTKAPDRQVRKARFVVIRETAIPSVLIETGFLSNSTERGKLIERDYQRKVANAIAEGIVEYLADTKTSHTASSNGKKK